jgi:voltage-gated potassium channel Kch
MKLSRLHPKSFWSSERGLTSLLIVTLAYLFVMCALGHFRFGKFVADIFFSLIVVAGVLTTFRQPWVRFLAVALAVASLSITWFNQLRPEDSLTILDMVLRIVFLGLLLAVLVIQVFGAGPVTPHRIRGAIVVYLLLGGMWSFFYFLAALTIPHAFHWLDGRQPADLDALERALTYFSYITLTTTGYGDIAPAAPLTRTLAMFEALTGQIYLAITLARLVSLAIMGQKDSFYHKSKD